MTTIEERAIALIAAIEAEPNRVPISMLEFVRKQELSLALELGLNTPQFRTEIALKFAGQSANEHDLSAEIATGNILSFVELVDVSSETVHGQRGKPNLFFSPNIKPGSTIFTLYGEPSTEPIGQPSMIDEVFETALDATLRVVFDSIRTIISIPDTSRVEGQFLDSAIGDKLYRFANKLVATDTEIDLIWESATGRLDEQKIDFTTASHIKTMLDVPRTTREPKTRSGVIEWIDLDGSFQTKLESDHGRKVELVAPTSEMENLRSYWGHRVEISFIEIEIVHPQRGEKKREYEFLAIRLLSEQTLLDE